MKEKEGEDELLVWEIESFIGYYSVTFNGPKYKYSSNKGGV